MKQMSGIKYRCWIYTFAWLALHLVVGCTQADVEDGNIPLHVLKDVDAGFHLNVLASRKPTRSSIPLNTRAAQPLDEEQESKIAGLWVGQYDASSETLLYSKYFSSFTGNTVNIKLKQSPDKTESHVWFIANAGNPGEIDSETNLKGHVLSYASTATGLPTSNLCGMTGMWKGVVTEGGVKDITVELTRLLAKIEFTYSMKKDSLTFTPTSVTLKSVPQKSQVDSLKNQLADMTYTSYSGIVDENGATMYWYLPENMAGTVSGTDAVSSEKKKTGKGVSNATFVELTGTAVQGGVTYEDVTFCFYPGSNENNYDIERNSYYKMDVTLVGIDISDERITVGKIPPIVVTEGNMPAEKGGIKEVQITARPGQAWSFDLEEWLSAVIEGKEAGTGVTVSHQGPAKVSFQAVAANPKAEERSVSFSVNVNGKDQGITITQDGSTLTKGKDISLGAASGSEGSSTCRVTKGLQWQAAVSGEDWWNWADSNPVISGGESDGSDLPLSIKSVYPNPLAQERTGKITVTAGASMGNPGYSGLKGEITVKQAGSTVKGSTVVLEPVAFGSQSSSFTATPGLDWVANVTKGDWITLTGSTSGSPTTGSAQDITFDVTVNPTASPRSGAITVRAGTESGGLTGVITVSQKASSFSVTSPATEIASTGGSVTGSVTATTGLSWIINPETDNEITVSPTSGTGDATLTFTASANTGTERSGSFIVKVTGASPERTTTITATQIAAVANQVTIDNVVVESYKKVTTNYKAYPPFNYDGGVSSNTIGSDRNGVSSSCILSDTYSIEVEITEKGSNCTYAAAVSYCSNKGSGWRMPTMIELKAMYDDRTPLLNSGVTTFGNNWYWSSSVYNSTQNSRCVLIFKDGKFEYNYTTSVNYVRCVRDL